MSNQSLFILIKQFLGVEHLQRLLAIFKFLVVIRFAVLLKSSGTIVGRFKTFLVEDSQ